MKHLLLLICPLALRLNAQTSLPFSFQDIATMPANASGITYLVNQDFETVSTNPPVEANSTWGVSFNTISWNYTNTVLAGSYSMRPDPNNGSARVDFSDQTELHLKGKVNVNNTGNSSATPQIRFYDTNTLTAVIAARFYVNTTPLLVNLVAIGGTNTLATNSLSRNITYNFWMDYYSGGTCTLAVTTNTTKPTVGASGTAFVQQQADAGTISRIYFSTPGSTYSIFDDIQVSTSVIP